ncbi:MAG: ParM/StbA family protein [Peptococcaceae bacterium]|nr:ParM/StbA family protein [Peptococcaceae bacterium]
MIAVDVGYGLTKAMNISGKKVHFPSVVAPVRADMLNGLFGAGPGHHVKIRRISGEAEEKLVGEAAQNSMAALNTLAREKPAAIHDVLLLTGAYLAGAGGAGTMPERTNIAVGLPLAFYKSQKENLTRHLQGLAVWVSVNGGPEKYVSFDKVVVFPQGAGVVLAEMEKLSVGGLVGVVDVGTYTTDYLLMDVRNRQPVPIPDGCGSVEAGVYLFHRAVASEFQGRAGAPLPAEMVPPVAEKALAGLPVRYYNRDIFLPDVRRALREIGENIAQKVLAAWGNRAGYVERTLLAGGGSLLFREELLGTLPNARIVDDPLYANAKGYLTAFGPPASPTAARTED